MINRIVSAALAAPLLLGAMAVSASAQETAETSVPTIQFQADGPDGTKQTRTAPVAVDFDMAKDRENILLLDLSNGGRVAIRLMPEWAPGHVERIKTLTRQGFYDGTIFHRVIDGFMAQGGDPTGTGRGGSELPNLKAEFNPLPHVRGTLSMARAQDKDSANSQFFIVFYPRFSLDKTYTNLGRVISGMNFADAIERGEPPANPTRILQASIAADNKPQKMPTVTDQAAPIQLNLDGQFLAPVAGQ